MANSGFTEALGDFAGSIQRMLQCTQQLLQMSQGASSLIPPAIANPQLLSCSPPSSVPVPPALPLGPPPLTASGSGLSPPIGGDAIAGRSLVPTTLSSSLVLSSNGGGSTQMGVSTNPITKASAELSSSFVDVLQSNLSNATRLSSSPRPGAQRATDQKQRHRGFRRFNPPRRPFSFTNPRSISCYRCGDRGHWAKDCRNAVVCFTCGRLGHRSANCRSILSLPSHISPVVPPQMADPVPAPLIRVFPNRENQKLQEKLMRCLIFHDTFSFGAPYVKSQLARLFDEVTIPWVVKTMPSKRLLVEPPDLEWRAMVLSKGEIWLGDVSFVVEPYDPYLHDGVIRGM